MGYDHFHLYDCNNTRAVAIEVVFPNAAYTFALPQEIMVESASEWNANKICQLGIFYRYVDDFLTPLASETFSDAFPLGLFSQLVNEREALMASLAKVSKLRTVDVASLKPVEKALFIMRKHPAIASAVDLMVVFLLQLCGFYSERLFAFPKFPLELRFGDFSADATPDFAVFDSHSFCRIAVVQDKCIEEMDAEAQLMAEAIAMAQANRAKTREGQGQGQGHLTKQQAVGPDNVLGITIRGSLFTFYLIPVTNAILDAMTVRTSTIVQTAVTKSESFDLCDEMGSGEIVLHLLLFREIAAWAGRVSDRRSESESG
jgi:hypothetical protein